MIIPYILFWLLVGYGIVTGELYLGEAAAFVIVWCVILAAVLALGVGFLWSVAPAAILDIVLVLKLFGGDINIR